MLGSVISVMVEHVKKETHFKTPLRLFAPCLPPGVKMHEIKRFCNVMFSDKVSLIKSGLQFDLID